MKNLLILIVAIATYLHFYPNSEATKFYNEKMEFLLRSFSEFSDTKARMSAKKIYTDLQSDLASFSEEEIIHLKEITSSRRNLKEFNFDVCETKQRDVIFHINNEAKVCKTIANYPGKF